MAHLLEDGFFVKAPAWHGLGTVLENAPGVDEALQVSGLDWNVEHKRLVFVDKNGDNKESNMMALVRDLDDKILGYSTERYHILQNKEAFEWCRPLIDSGKWTFETGGSLREGVSPWVLLKQGEFEPVEGDVFKNYLMVYWSHDGTHSVRIFPTSIRVVCNNTLTQALNEGRGSGHTVRHSSKLPSNMADIQQLYLDLSEQFNNQYAAFKLMKDVKLKDFDILQYAAGLFNEFYPKASSTKDGRAKTIAENNKAILSKFAMSSSGTQELGIGNTVYNAFNGVQEAIEHILGGGRVRDRGMNIMFGDGRKYSDIAFNNAMALVAKGN